MSSDYPAKSVSGEIGGTGSKTEPTKQPEEDFTVSFGQVPQTKDVGPILFESTVTEAVLNPKDVKTTTDNFTEAAKKATLGMYKEADGVHLITPQPLGTDARRIICSGMAFKRT